jgi:xylose isomerase
MATLKGFFPSFNHLLGSKNPEEIPQKDFPFFAYYVQDQNITPKGGNSFEVNTTYLVIIGVKISSLNATDIEDLRNTAVKASEILFLSGFSKSPIEVEFVYRFPNVFAVLKFSSVERI